MAENNGSDATFSCLLWQKMERRKVCQGMMACGMRGALDGGIFTAPSM
ncbi:hypothetical protein [Pectobacterium peruviense]|nr:hypothetical protein [Pectobacterium peruviense]